MSHKNCYEKRAVVEAENRRLREESRALAAQNVEIRKAVEKHRTMFLRHSDFEPVIEVAHEKAVRIREQLREEILTELDAMKLLPLASRYKALEAVYEAAKPFHSYESCPPEDGSKLSEAMRAVEATEKRDAGV